MSRLSYLVTFDCFHTRIFEEPAPRINEIIWCPNCRKEVRVTSAPPEWRIRCTVCVFSKRFGTGKANAEIAAAKHSVNHPTHAIEIRNGNLLVNTIENRNQTVIEM